LARAQQKEIEGKRSPTRDNLEAFKP
jgi:hypothetical protein